SYVLPPLFFFFSSRRRHTRFSRDWSSDVCSSDLFGDDVLEGRPVSATSTHEDANDPAVVTSGTFAVRDPWRSGRLPDGSVDEARSEERRVGKECRSRGSA